MARRQRQRTERSRLSLLDAARAVFRDKGYEAASVAEIAKRAGRAHGTFYLYFDNKQDIYSALLASFGDQTTARFDTLALDADRVPAFRALRDLLTAFAYDRDLWDLLEEMAYHDEAATRLRTGLRTALSRRIQACAAAIPESAAIGLDLEVTGELFASMIFRLARLGALPASPAVTAVHLLTVWCRLMGLPEDELAGIATDLVEI